MSSETLIGMALGLESPWEIKSVEFKSEKNIKTPYPHIVHKRIEIQR